MTRTPTKISSRRSRKPAKPKPPANRSLENILKEIVAQQSRRREFRELATHDRITAILECARRPLSPGDIAKVLAQIDPNKSSVIHSTREAIQTLGLLGRIKLSGKEPRGNLAGGTQLVPVYELVK